MPICSIRPSFMTHDPVGDVHRLLLIVRDEDRRDVHLVVQAAQPRAQLLADARVERAERLVEEQHLRLDGERAGERHPLPLAAGELRRGSGPRARRAGRDRAAPRPASAISAFGRLRILRPNAMLFADGHVLEGRVVLEDEADAALLRRGAPVMSSPCDRDRPRRAARARRSPAAASTCRCRSGRAARSASRSAIASETSSSAVKSPKRFVTLAGVDRHLLRAFLRAEDVHGEQRRDREQREHDRRQRRRPRSRSPRSAPRRAASSSRSCRRSGRRRR